MQRGHLNMLESVILKELTTIEQIAEARILEQAIWDVDSIPIHRTISSIRNGGIVIGAYYNDQLIGFNYSAPGFVDGEIYLYSHMLGVKREYRERGVGELIKIYLKELATERGYVKGKWTFDPLEARSGHLNFAKLRSHCNTYIENCYGELEDPFNKDLPTDRLLVEWQMLDDNYLRWDAKLEEMSDEADFIVDWALNEKGLPALVEEQIPSIDEKFTEVSYKLPIPTAFQKIKIEGSALAEHWRFSTRQLFQQLFNQGYTILSLQSHNEHISYYLFVKRSLFAI
jgi:predicted GNAT superfamily acetyltransferase